MAAYDVPFRAVRAAGGMVATADQLATQAGMSALDRGGNAIDAAIAANAAMAVCAPHLCGMGGDLFALVWDGTEVHALNASGRAGSGADAAALRAEGHTAMPLRHHPAAVTVPGCVDGWVCATRAVRLACRSATSSPRRSGSPPTGFAASPLLAGSVALLDDVGRSQLHELVAQVTAPGSVVVRPGAARALRCDRRRRAGRRSTGASSAPGSSLSPAGCSPRPTSSLRMPTGSSRCRRAAFGVDLHTIPPNSQGYLTLGAALVAEQLDLPDDPDDPRWAHLLIEASIVAGHDRPDVLHDGADGAELLARIVARATTADPELASGRRGAGVCGRHDLPVYRRRRRRAQ